MAQATFETSNCAQTGNSKAPELSRSKEVSQIKACPEDEPLNKNRSVGSREMLEKKEHDLKVGAV